MVRLNSESERMFHLQQSLLNIGFAMCCGERALLGRQRKYINTAVDKYSAEFCIVIEIVVHRQIVPVFGKMIHEIHAKGRTLPCNNSGYSELSNYIFYAAFQHVSEGFYMPINLAIVHQ